MTNKTRILLAATLAIVATGPAVADDVDAINAMITSLAPIAGQTDASAPVDTDVGKTVYVVPAASVDLEVFFNFNSDGLTQDTQHDLNALGWALLSDELMPFSYLVAGHTDASGPAAYNQKLSERRAMTVRNYLIEEFGVDPDRLIRVGWGETRLKLADEPYSAVNRRVEITLIAPSEDFADTEAGAIDPMQKNAPVAEEPVDSTQQSTPSSSAEEAPLSGTLQTDEKGNVSIVW